MAKREYVTMRGKKVDLELLKKINELVPAVGNAKVNARGDEIGPGGRIVKKREDIIKDYYKNSPNQVVSETTQRPVAPIPAVSTEAIADSDWLEDDSGNFVKKEKTTKKPKAE